MQALLDATPLELPKCAGRDARSQRMRAAPRQDLQAARHEAPSRCRCSPAAVRRAGASAASTLGLILGELVKRENLQPKPEQVRALVEEQAQSYEQPDEVVRWFYSEPERLAEFEALALEDNVVEWALAKAEGRRTRTIDVRRTDGNEA